MRVLLALLLSLALPAQASDAMWSLLKGGGQVVLIRHAVTTPGFGDPPGFTLDDCKTQRNLSGAGRAHAQRIGQAFKARQVPVERVLSSPWCRCLETARLAFRRMDGIERALDNLFGRPENNAKQVEQSRALLGSKVEKNLVLVSHGSTIVALTGISPGTGEMVIVTPRGNGKFAVAGRLGVD